MIHPTSGDAKVLGKRINDPTEGVELRRKVAYVSENKRLYDYMTVEQVISFTKSFYPDWRPEVERKLLSDFNLPLTEKSGRCQKGRRRSLRFC